MCPGLVTAMGVSMGLTAAAVNAKGTIAQRERWALDLLTLDKIGAWAITEPDSGSDAFGSMKSTARRDGDEYVLNGSKTFITNGPYADTIVFICKLDEGNPPEERTVLQFVLDSGMPGLVQSKPLRKMGIHSSPTGELFLDDVRVGKDRLLGESEEAFKGGGGREASKATFSIERAGVAAMALGIVERCLELSIAYANDRVQFGQPIGQFQLIQLKLAKMEVARMNLQNIVFRNIEMGAGRARSSLRRGLGSKLYAAQAATEVAIEAVQLFGGNGYMAEYEVEQLARDAKVLQIYAGTDEIQVTAVAKALLAPSSPAPPDFRSVMRNARCGVRSASRIKRCTVPPVTTAVIGVVAPAFEELVERCRPRPTRASSTPRHRSWSTAAASDWSTPRWGAPTGTNRSRPTRSRRCTAPPSQSGRGATLSLIAEDELSFDDRLGDVIEGIPVRWIADRTVEEVLGHTAGLHVINTILARILPGVAAARTGSTRPSPRRAGGSGWIGRTRSSVAGTCSARPIESLTDQPFDRVRASEPCSSPTACRTTTSCSASTTSRSTASSARISVTFDLTMDQPVPLLAEVGSRDGDGVEPGVRRLRDDGCAGHVLPRACSRTSPTPSIVLPADYVTYAVAPRPTDRLRRDAPTATPGSASASWHRCRRTSSESDPRSDSVRPCRPGRHELRNGRPRA